MWAGGGGTWSPRDGANLHFTIRKHEYSGVLVPWPIANSFYTHIRATITHFHVEYIKGGWWMRWWTSHKNPSWPCNCWDYWKRKVASLDVYKCGLMSVRRDSWWWSKAGQPHSGLSAERWRGLEREERTCTECDLGKVEDVQLWLLECKRYGKTNGRRPFQSLSRVYHQVVIRWLMMRSYLQFWTKDASIAQS